MFLLPVLTVWADGAGEGAHSDNITHSMMLLALQLGLIIFFGYLGARIARKIKFPAILGELLIGILIGPFLLGAVPLPGFSSGLFPHSGSAVAVSPELFGFAMVASIVLLFLSGLQTDVKLFLRFAGKGSIVGIGGALVSLVTGLYIGSLIFDGQWLSPSGFFLGVTAIATSVDITARILSDRHKMASPEGVTILAASVIEDVIGITILAVVIGVDSYISDAGFDYTAIMLVAVRALAVWLVTMTLGILFSQKISRLLKLEPNHSHIAVLALGMALIVAGLFESAGLAMIIGAYVVGLSLSNTDLSYVIQEKIEVIHHFFDPIFFVVIGMLINLQILFSTTVIFYGVLFGVLGLLARIIGCGIPSLATGFTWRGSLRISLGMMPRGEVALIIAGIGISTGLLNDTLFGIVVLMTLITTLVAPPFFSRSLSGTARGTRNELERSESVNTDFQFGSREITDFLLTDIIASFQSEGFFIHISEMEQRLFQMRRELVYISLVVSDNTLLFSSQKEDVTFINNLVYESILTLQSRVEELRKISKPVELQKTLVEKNNRTSVNWYQTLDIDCISLQLRSRDKEAIILELIDMLHKADKLNDLQTVQRAVIEREKSMSTGMQNGIAIPHGRSEGANELCVAVGLVPNGVDFDSLDGKATKVFFLIVSPARDPGPHLQVLSGIAGVLNNQEAVDEIVKSPSRTDVITYMVSHSRT
ncbi:cation:proton antiporter [Spirochaeta dissipatitropha]